MKIEVRIDSPKVTPPTSQVMQVKRDQFTLYQIDEPNSYGVRGSAPAPAVMNTGEIDNNRYWTWSDLTRERQFFWADLLSMQVYGLLYADLNTTQRNRIITAFKGLTLSNKFLTNDRGTDKYHNYLTGENANQEDPRVAPLICCDDWVQVRGTGINKHGVPMAQLQGFVLGDPLPSVTPDLLKDPRVLWATIITETGEIRNFPQLDGLPVPYPYMTGRDWWYQLEDLQPIPAGARWSTWYRSLFVAGT